MRMPLLVSIPYSLIPIPSFSLFPNVLIPNLRMSGNITFQQFTAFAAVQVNHFHAVLAQPAEASGKGAALADN